MWDSIRPRVLFLPGIGLYPADPDQHGAATQGTSIESCRDNDERPPYSKLVTLYGDQSVSAAEMAHRGNFLCINEYPSFLRHVESYNERNSEIHRKLMRRRLKKERREGSYHKAEEHPEYKGNMDLDELLEFINQGHPHGTKFNHASVTNAEPPVETGKDKPTRRKKKSLDHGETPYFKPVRSESAGCSSDTEAHSNEANHWQKNSTRDDSCLPGSGPTDSKSVSHFTASSILSVKTESVENNSETESIVSSLQECCLSDGGIDMTSSSFNDREFITVYKKKRVKGSQPSMNTNRCFSRNNNGFKFSSNASNFSNNKVYPKGNTNIRLGGAQIVTDDVGNLHYRPGMATNVQTTTNIQSGANSLRFSYAKAVGESSIDIDTNSVLSSSAFPHLRRNSTENMNVIIVEGSSISSPPSECSSETTSGVSSMKEYPISYASIAASTLMSSGVQDKRRQSSCNSQIGERERRHSFDSGTESMPVKSCTDVTVDDMSMHNTEEFPPITSRNVGGSAHALCSFESQRNADDTAVNSALNSEIIGSKVWASDCSDSSINNSSQVSQNARKNAPVATRMSVCCSDEMIFSATDVVLRDESLDKSAVPLKTDNSDYIETNISSDMITLGVVSLKSSVIKTGDNITSISNNIHCPMGIQYLEKPGKVEPVVFLDKRSDKYDKIPKELEISFGFDSDFHEDCDSPFTPTTGSADQADHSVTVCNETSTIHSPEKTESFCTDAAISEPLTGSPRDIESSETTLTVQSGCELSTSASETNIKPIFTAQNVVAQHNPSPVFINQCSPNTTHSRPIALMSGTSTAQSARTPVGVVPPLNHVKSSSESTAINNHSLQELCDKDSTDLSFEKIAEPRNTWMKVAPPGNGYSASMRRRSGNFDLFSAQVFLYKGFEDTLSARSQCTDNIIHYSTDSEGY